MNTNELIDVSVLPERYKCKISSDGKFLSIMYPTYIGFLFESIQEIRKSEVEVTIKTKSAIVSLWIDVEHIHVTIL